MPSSVEAALNAKKLKLLRQIESALDRSNIPTVRACGLTEEQARWMANAELISIFQTADFGEFVDLVRIERILPAGESILSMADADDYQNLRNQFLPVPFWKRISQALGNILLGIVRIIFGLWK